MTVPRDGHATFFTYKRESHPIISRNVAFRRSSLSPGIKTDFCALTAVTQGVFIPKNEKKRN
jgi:hypothetical protein